VVACAKLRTNIPANIRQIATSITLAARSNDGARLVILEVREKALYHINQTHALKVLRVRSKHARLMSKEKIKVACIN